MSPGPWRAERWRRRPSPDRSQKGEKAQGRGRHDRDKRSSGRYDNHQQGHCRTHGKRYGRCQCGLHGARGGGLRNAKLIAGVGGKGIFRHELPGDLPRKVPIDATLDVDIGKLIELEFGVPLNSWRSRARSARSVSDCELTDTYSPAAIDIAPPPVQRHPRSKRCSVLRPPPRRR